MPTSAFHPHHSRQYAPTPPQVATPPRQAPLPKLTATPRQTPTVEVRIPQPAPASLDHTQLLLSLADEYIAAAHSIGSRVALARPEAEEDKYYKLMATGLGCMESVLKNFRLHPRMEATLVLKYAGLLYQETDNALEVETILSRGITLCERHRLIDLKYSMQHLLARVLFKTNHSAALKSIDNVLRVAEAYNHIVWIYAFRFLRASLSMKSGLHGELLSAQNNLRNVASIAEKQGDSAVYVAASAIEAMVHLHILNSDSVEQAQRAIASARSLQLQLSTRELGQIVALLDLVDLACNLRTYKPDQAVAKMRDMQAIMDSAVNGDNGRDDGSFAILIQRTTGGQTTASTGGIFRKYADGRDMLTVSWMRRRDLWTLGYFVSGVTALLKNPTEDKAESYLREGLKLTRESLNKPDLTPVSVQGACERMEWHLLLDWHLRMHQAFLACNKSDWRSARSHIASLSNTIPQPFNEQRKSMERFVTYLNGVVEQGTGNIEAALEQFQLLRNYRSTGRDAQADLSILASMNSLLILRDPRHPKHDQADDLLRSLEPQCLTHPSKSIISAFYLLRAISHSKESSIIKMKQCIQQALHAAKSVSNNQLLCISMNYMTAMFFTNIIGEQAEKSAKAGRSLAKRAGNSLWTCVADGMLAGTYDKHGNVEGAAWTRHEAEQLIPTLPEPLKQAQYPSGV
ncbi:uncharacterized protein K452DRAFT_219688 [Aplosporella prunicola CBS 121167]|uniref:Cohesin loading factor n=1 Tax=Aplosporella prunicola CBS 121167 TaxID=1176127 RepID=A0A6A6BPV8_9PEZI|nr:uncharacterized protein K452DRAFT_219688 [Aplosporella prunicola CBS 121167]KAF2146126.1 hypothetical protein K452DRAFT_219688 [Aplosporella prunicola CBS 121167]